MSIELNVRQRNTDDGGSYENSGFKGSATPSPKGSQDTLPESDRIGYANKGFKSDTPVESDSVVCTIPSDNGIGVPTQINADAEKEYEKEPNACLACVGSAQNGVTSTYKEHNVWIWRVIYILLSIAYAVYFGFAMAHRFGDEGSIRLLWVTCLVVFGLIVYAIYKFAGKTIYDSCLSPIREFFAEKRNFMKVLKVILFLVVVGLIVAFLVVEVILKDVYNLVSAGGLAVYVFLTFTFSHNPAKVKWRPVIWGLILQLIFAYIILRTVWGYEAFKWLGERVVEFLDHTDAGSKFVFGDKYTDHYFALKVLPVIIFFSTAISVLYYLGVMQFVIKGVAIIMQYAMKTTAGESLNAAGNIFVGQTEAPLLIRPLLGAMTRSELHAVMTGGFATIAGGVLAAYISIGVPANHLLSASVMSAPAALAMAKLSYPETEKSNTKAKDVMHMERPPERNVIEAASAGASASVKLVANIAANLIAFLAILAFINATLTWLGERVGLENFTFEFICSYLLWPLAAMMGADTQDCRKVAELLGVKTFLNEFIAYDRLGVLIKNSRTFAAYNGTVIYYGDNMFLEAANTTLVGGVITQRSEIISTYALCGFSNVGSIGIQLGALGAMAPHRKKDLASIAVRAMIAGNVACFMTACIAGLFYSPR